MKTKGLLALALLLVVASAATGFWGGRGLVRRTAEKEALRLARGCASRIASLKEEAAAWADAVSRGQGEAVLHASVSGISPALQADRRESLEISAVSLLRVPGVAGIHLLSHDGKALYSGDVKLTTTGEIGEGGRWALAAPELDSRPGARERPVPLAAPLIDAGRLLAVVWMECAQAAVRDAVRPAGLASSPAPAARVAAGASTPAAPGQHSTGSARSSPDAGRPAP